MTLGKLISLSLCFLLYKAGVRILTSLCSWSPVEESCPGKVNPSFFPWLRTHHIELSMKQKSPGVQRRSCCPPASWPQASGCTGPQKEGYAFIELSIFAGRQGRGNPKITLPPVGLVPCQHQECCPRKSGLSPPNPSVSPGSGRAVPSQKRED